MRPGKVFTRPPKNWKSAGVPFPIAADDKPRREDALAYYRAVVSSVV